MALGRPDRARRPGTRRLAPHSGERASGYRRLVELHPAPSAPEQRPRGRYRADFRRVAMAGAGGPGGGGGDGGALGTEGRKDGRTEGRKDGRTEITVVADLPSFRPSVFALPAGLHPRLQEIQLLLRTLALALGELAPALGVGAAQLQHAPGAPAQFVPDRGGGGRVRARARAPLILLLDQLDFAFRGLPTGVGRRLLRLRHAHGGFVYVAPALQQPHAGLGRQPLGLQLRGLRLVLLLLRELEASLHRLELGLRDVDL